MKKLISISLVLMTALILSPKLSYAKSEIASKTYNKEYAVNSDARLTIHNQFGKVNLIAWDQNRVEITVEVTVEANSEEKADKKLSQIEVIINGSESEVSVLTELKKSSNFNGDFSIDMKIKSPPGLQLDLENEFGDVVMTEWDGPAEVSVEYGTLNANKFTSENVTIKLEFSKGTIGLINQADVKLEYSDKFTLDKAKEIHLDAEFSQIDIETVERLYADNEYGELNVGMANQVDFSGEFCGFTLGKLYVRGKFRNEYGGIKINFVSKSFEELVLINSFSGVKVYFEEGSSFDFKCSSEYGDVSIMDDADLRIDKQEMGEQYLEGSYGSGTPKSKVEAEVEYGGIAFKMAD